MTEQTRVSEFSPEHRHHARTVTRQRARLVMPDGASLLVVIKDFCPTGLHLAFLESNALAAIATPFEGVWVSVSLESAEKTAAALSFQGRITHISSSDLGLYVEDMPAPILQALKSSAISVAASPSAPSSIEGEAGILQACNRHFGLFQDALIEDFMTSMDRDLSDARDEASSISEQSAFKYAVQVFRQNGRKIRDDFRRGLIEQIKDEGRTPVKSHVSGGISLVGQDEFEDWLNLSNVITHIESEFSTPLGDIEQRYAGLTRRPIDGKNNPFGPAMIGQVFQDALACMDLSNDVRKRFYLVFGASLARHYPSLIGHLREALAQVQVSSAKKRAPVPSDVDHHPVAPVESDGQGAGGTGGGVSAPSAEGGLDQAAAPAAGGEGAEYSLDRLLSVLNRTWQGGGGSGGSAWRSAGVARQESGRGADTPGGEKARPHAMQVAGGLQQIVQSLARLPGMLRGDQGAADTQPAVPDNRPVASLDQLIQAVDALPVPESRGETPPEPLNKQVGAQLRSVAGKPVQVDPQAQQVLNLMSDLLGKALAQYPITSDIENLVRKLERPLLKLALKDESFLEMDDHPARQVVNVLDQFSIAADDKGKIFDQGLRTFLHQLVDRICAMPEQDPAFYSSINVTLEKILQPIHQHRRLRVARLQEASEGRDRIRKARARVSDFLGSRLAGREIPEIIVRMLDTGWQQYLVLLELRHGMDSSAFSSAMELLDQLCAYFSPDFKGGEHFEPGVRNVLRLVERNLLGVNVDTADVAQFMSALQDSLLQADGPESPMVLFPAERFEASSVQEAQIAQRHEALIERMRMGDWWDMLIDGVWVPMQLIWTSQSIGSCAFANRSAINKLEISLDELAQRIQANQARPGDDQSRPLLERSEHAMVDEAYHRLRDQAIHHPMTGLINRKGFMHRLHQAANAADAAEHKHAVAILEFDAFRMIYNQHGVEAGEVLARELADQVKAILRPEDVVASFDEDTIALFFADTDEEQARALVQQLIERLKNYRFTHGGGNYSIGVNIGLVDFSPLAIGMDEVVRQADSACVASKSSGRNQIQTYEISDDKLHSHEELMEWASIVDRLLDEEGGLFLRFQMVMPIRNYSTLKPYYEILLGVNGLGEPGDTAPQNFIIAVERLNRAHEVDLWVMGQIFSWIRQNRMLFDSIGGFSLNLSAWSLRSPEVLGFLHEEFGKGDLPADRLIFEITETMAIDSYAAAQSFIQDIRHYGCKFSIDDFGSGHASYAYLKDLRTDVLKIDGYFVKDLAESETDYAMVKSMNEIAHSLGMRTVAEYVESPEILERLREIGVDYAQGFSIHKPVPMTQLGNN